VGCYHQSPGERAGWHREDGKMAVTPYTVQALRARRKGISDFNFMKQIADLLNALETETDKRQELLDAYRNAPAGKGEARSRVSALLRRWPLYRTKDRAEDKEKPHR
jgi:hypothetical protein